MEFTEQEASRVLFYLCNGCLKIAENPDIADLKDFVNFQKVQHIIYEAKCCNCSAEINGLGFTAQLPLNAKSMTRSFKHWNNSGYCYLPARPSIWINI